MIELMLYVSTRYEKVINTMLRGVSWYYNNVINCEKNVMTPYEQCWAGYTKTLLQCYQKLPKIF